MATRTTMSRDGTHRRLDGKGTLVLLSCLAVVALVGCNLDQVTSPNDPAALTGQNPTQTVSFNGTVQIFFGGTTVGPDGETDVLISARARDAEGDLVQNGTPINFTTTFGLLRPVGTSPTQGSGSVSVITFNGTATVALRATGGGEAVVTAAIADVSSSLTLEFADLPFVGTIELQVRVDGVIGDTGTTEAPADVDLVATARDENGLPLAGVRVRFRIVADRTRGSGEGPAFFVGQGSSVTDQAGQAEERVRIQGAGDVIFEAQLLDPDDGSVVATSNQTIVTTTAGDPAEFFVDLTFVGGATSTSGEAPFSVGMVASVTNDEGEEIGGAPVRFRIVSDSTGDATLAESGTTNTDSNGDAFNTLNVPTEGEQVVVEARLINPDTGAVVTTSNQIVATADPADGTGEVFADLTFTDGSTSFSDSAPYSTGMEAEVTDEGGTPVAGATVRFTIVSDNLGTATFAAGTGSGAGATSTTTANSSGQAFETLNVDTPGQQVVVEAEVLDDTGAVVATSNQIVATGE